MARNKYNVDEELDAPFSFKQLKRGLAYVVPYKKNLLISFTCAVISIVLGLLTPMFIQFVIDDLIPGRKISLLVAYSLGFACLLIIIVLCNRTRSRYNTLTGQSVITDIRKGLFTHLQNLSFDYYDSRPHGKILVRVVNYVNSVADFLSNGMVNSLLELISLVFITVYMFIVSPRLAVVILAGLPVFAVYVFITKPIQRRSWQRLSNKQSNTTAYLAENINGVRVTQAFARQGYNGEIFNSLLTDTRRAWMKAIYLIHGMWPVTSLLQSLVTAAIYTAAVYLYRDTVSVGTVIAMAAYAGRFWGPIQNLGNIYNSLISTVAYLERIFQVLDEPVTIRDKPGAAELGAISGRVEFDRVIFEYEPGRPVLKDVSFTVEPGESIALVGPTGAGKSTIISLLSRFYDLNSGSIRVDGQDISEVTLNSLRRQMGIMLQDTFVFSGSYMSNIRYGRLDATDEECVASAKAVYADSFIAALPEGYITQISERGEGLSSGQKQLLSFARTMLADPRILILDEATSSIDTNTEMLVQEGIARMLRGRTSFIVAHRLSTIKNCTRILYIADGGIAEMGSHKELMEKRGLYYQLYMSQIVREDG
ncbi:MAG: ABC transporter ATP-binding protein/permease [Clostridiales bacterium]|nr:ABC transporter ATP-binding protein/permease [Clostridiales bacterium]